MHFSRRVQIGRLSSNASLSHSLIHSLFNYSGVENLSRQILARALQAMGTAGGRVQAAALSCTHSLWHSRTHTNTLRSAWWDANRVLFARDFVIYAASANFSINPLDVWRAAEELRVLSPSSGVGALCGGENGEWMEIRAPQMKCGVRGRPHS